MDPDRWEFANEGFVEGSREVLGTIQRRKPTGTSTAQRSALAGMSSEQQQQQAGSQACFTLPPPIPLDLTGSAVSTGVPIFQSSGPPTAGPAPPPIGSGQSSAFSRPASGLPSLPPLPRHPEQQQQQEQQLQEQQQQLARQGRDDSGSAACLERLGQLVGEYLRPAQQHMLVAAIGTQLSEGEAYAGGAPEGVPGMSGCGVEMPCSSGEGSDSMLGGGEGGEHGPGGRVGAKRSRSVFCEQLAGSEVPAGAYVHLAAMLCVRAPGCHAVCACTWLPCCVYVHLAAMLCIRAPGCHAVCSATGCHAAAGMAGSRFVCFW